MIKKEHECANLDELKKGYEKLSKEYNLPNFNKLNELFEVEDVNIETDFLLRKIRRFITEKAAGYLRFIDIILNPSSTPIFFFKKIKRLDSNDKEKLSNIYEILGDIETESILLDLHYSEEKEVEFINKIFRIFDEDIKNDLMEVIKKLMNVSEKESKNDKISYFG